MEHSVWVTGALHIVALLNKVASGHSESSDASFIAACETLWLWGTGVVVG